MYESFKGPTNSFGLTPTN